MVYHSNSADEDSFTSTKLAIYHTTKLRWIWSHRKKQHSTSQYKCSKCKGSGDCVESLMGTLKVCEMRLLEKQWRRGWRWRVSWRCYDIAATNDL